MSTPDLPASMRSWEPHPDGSSGWLPPGLFAELADAQLATARAEVARDRLAAGLSAVMPLADLALSQLEAAGYSQAVAVRAELDQLKAAVADAGATVSQAQLDEAAGRVRDLLG
jgi:hypothetical protein